MVEEKIDYDTFRTYLPRVAEIKKMSDFYFIFSDMTRLFILATLSMQELCVSQISEILSVNQTTISHQLKLLRDVKIVDFRRDKSLIYYRIINPFVNEVINIGINHINYNSSKY